MTDKQIIIDGVDVSGCEWFYKNDPCKNTCKYFLTPCERVEIQNCMYKYAKRKEQECENGIKRIKDLEERIINHSNEIEEYCSRLADKEQECEKKSWEIGNLGYKIKNQRKEINIRLKQLDQLKAENDELKNKTFRYEELLKHSAMAQNTYTAEEVNTIASGIKFVGNSLIAEENNKLHKTLTEIKEIAEILITTTDEYDSCYYKDKCSKCEVKEDCQYIKVEQILQKISEVENET